MQDSSDKQVSKSTVDPNSDLADSAHNDGAVHQQTQSNMEAFSQTSPQHPLTSESEQATVEESKSYHSPDNSRQIKRKRSATQRSLQVLKSKATTSTQEGVAKNEGRTHKLITRQPSIQSQCIIRTGAGTTLGALGKSGTTNSMAGVTSTNQIAISNSNLSMNTSTNRVAIDEEDNLMFSSEEETTVDESAQVAALDSCSNMRFVRHSECISKSKYRTIHLGYDNESGCEIAWTTYPLGDYKRERLLMALEVVKELGQTQGGENNCNILRVYHHEVRPIMPQTSGLSSIQPQALGAVRPRPSILSSKSMDIGQLSHHLGAMELATPQEELIVVSELITAGSIREYLKKIKTLRLNVIKRWCQKVLEALQFLHAHDIVHGELSCESIYINSNNGEIKVGDVGIKHIHTDYRSLELGACKQYLKEKDTLKVDVFCFGLTLLEIVAASESKTSRFALKNIIRVFNRGDKDRLLQTLRYEPMKDFLAKALHEDPAERFGVEELLSHPFLKSVSKLDNHNFTKLSDGIVALLKEHTHQRREHHHSKNSNSLHLSALNDSTAVRRPKVSNRKLEKRAKELSANGKHASCDKSGVVQQSQNTMMDKHALKSEHKHKSKSKLGLTKGKNSQTMEMPERNSISNLKPQRQPVNSFVEAAEQATNQAKAEGTSGRKLPSKEFNDTPTSKVLHSIEEVSFKSPSRRKYSSKNLKAIYRGGRGKTTTFLELPKARQNLLMTAPAKMIPSKLIRKNASPNQKHVRMDEMGRARASSFPNSSCFATSGIKESVIGTPSKFTEQGASPQKTVTGFDSQFESSRKHSAECASDAQQDRSAVESKLTGRPGEASLPKPISEEDNASAEQPQQQEGGPGTLFFSIRIVMASRSKDVKFPFDLLKDSPRAVATELRDCIMQEGEGVELPDSVVEAVREEIQRGIDAHYHKLRQAKLQKVFTFREKQQIDTSQKEGNDSPETAHEQQKTPQFHQVQSLTDEQQNALRAKQAANEAALAQQLLEEEAERQEQLAMEENMAHDYLSCQPLFESEFASRFNTSLPLIEKSDYDSPGQMSASLQAEIQQMLQDGQLNEEEYQLRMQQARRKVSISQNSDGQGRYPGGADSTQYLYERAGGNLVYYGDAGNQLAPSDMIEEPCTENYSQAVIEFEPQIPHNNTTGERHEAIIQEQQKNGPFGQQDILLYRNSIEYNDPDLINFMHNPDDDLVYEKTSTKDRKCVEQNSAKSEAQESLWLLRELFPGYMERYHEDYVNNHLNAQPLAMPLLVPSNVPQHSSSAAELQHSSLLLTMDLSLTSLEGSHLFADSSQTHKDVNSGSEPPFQLDISCILASPDNDLLMSSMQTIPQLGQARIERAGPRLDQKPKSSSSIMPPGDFSSHQLNLHSDVEDTPVVKGAAQLAANAKHRQDQQQVQRSFIQDCSESLLMQLGNMSTLLTPHHFNLKKEQITATASARPPSNQSTLNTQGASQGFPLPSKLNNSQRYHPVTNFAAGQHREDPTTQSAHSHFDPKAMTQLVAAQLTKAKTSQTGTVPEIPANIATQRTLDYHSAATSANDYLHRTEDGNGVKNAGVGEGPQPNNSDSQSSHILAQKQTNITRVPQAFAYGHEQNQIQVISSSSMEASVLHPSSINLLAAQPQPQPQPQPAQSEPVSQLAKVVQTLEQEESKQLQAASAKLLLGSQETSGRQKEDQIINKVRTADLPLRMTPSVVDVQKSISQTQAEAFLNESNTQMGSRFQSQVSIKGFPAISAISIESDGLTPPHAQEQQQTEAFKFSIQPQQLEQPGSENSPHIDSGFSPYLLTRPSEEMKSMRKNSITLSEQQQSNTVHQDLERLLQIKQAGMRSEKLEKGFRKMYKEDIMNLYFALCTLGVASQDGLSDIDIDKSQSSVGKGKKVTHFGANIRNMVKRFKKREGLPATHKVDPQTWESIIESAIQNLRLICNVASNDLESVVEQEEEPYGAQQDLQESFSSLGMASRLTEAQAALAMNSRPSGIEIPRKVSQSMTGRFANYIVDEEEGEEVMEQEPDYFARSGFSSQVEILQSPTQTREQARPKSSAFYRSDSQDSYEDANSESKLNPGCLMSPDQQKKAQL